MEQLDLIFQLLGTPNATIWPAYQSMPLYEKFPPPTRRPSSNLRSKVPNLSEVGYDLMKGLLAYDPTKRLTAKQALRHKWFEENPLPQ
eukprot:gene11866-20184_t